MANVPTSGKSLRYNITGFICTQEAITSQGTVLLCEDASEVGVVDQFAGGEAGAWVKD